MASKRKKGPPGNVVAQNRKARHDYTLVEDIEAGIMLTGTEVKSLRKGRGSLVDAYAVEEDGALYLYNADIPKYEQAALANHEPKRKRKLLLHRREIARLSGAVNRKGMALVPLAIYFNDRGIAKVQLALAEGKRQFDKRETEKARDWGRQKARLLRDKG
ncbi:MAG: SsrA-binding protein [Rhodospirillales bacterium CG15_BIG_FIL_POST_REV_8_21_14_020_66_15]|nr:MAG: SsrA-binding protein [Rhodospirillales bacterium CG15_BIG_FIL_POST_REV_8_21_14_020_66_15]